MRTTPVLAMIAAIFVAFVNVEAARADFLPFSNTLPPLDNGDLILRPSPPSSSYEDSIPDIETWDDLLDYLNQPPVLDEQGLSGACEQQSLAAQSSCVESSCYVHVVAGPPPPPGFEPAAAALAPGAPGNPATQPVENFEECLAHCENQAIDDYEICMENSV